VATDTLTLKGLDQETVTAWSRALGDPDWLRARRLEINKIEALLTD
jgi:hypothetical protein